MRHQDIDVVEPEPLEPGLRFPRQRVAIDLVGPHLGEDDDFLARYAGGSHGLSDFPFIAVMGGGIEQAVAHAQGFHHQRDAGIAFQRSGAETNGRQFGGDGLRHDTSSLVAKRPTLVPVRQGENIRSKDG